MEMPSNSLLEQYLVLQPNLSIVYVSPPYIANKHGNNYLQLLYEPFTEGKLDVNISIVGISTLEYPKLFFRKLKGEKSILHIHWYHFNSVKRLISLLWRTLWMVLYRLIGGKIVWTVHNKYPHFTSYRLINAFFRFCMARIANKLHVHCRTAIEIMSKIFRINQSKFFVYEHPPYKARFMDRNLARKELAKYYPTLALDEKTIAFLMFGLIAEYKGIEEVVTIFEELNANVKLLVVGGKKSSRDKYAKKIEEMSTRSKNVFVHSKSFPEEHIPLLFNSIDVIILNYKEILTSGVYYLAKSYNKKIITISKGCLQEAKGEDIMLFLTEDELKAHILNIVSEKT